MKNIPNLDSLYDEVVAYVKEHQGEKGYIDCQPSLNEDIIYGIVYDDFVGSGLEKYVYAVRVVDNDLECLLEDITGTWRTVYTDEDYKNEEDKWYSVRWSDVYYVPTLFNIAECIEEYEGNS
jgi:hypothetical protein